MRELNPIEIQHVGGGADAAVQVSVETQLGALLAPWAAAPVVSVTPVLGVSVTVQLPALPPGIDNRTAGS